MDGVGLATPVVCMVSNTVKPEVEAALMPLTAHTGKTSTCCGCDHTAMADDDDILAVFRRESDSGGVEKIRDREIEEVDHASVRCEWPEYDDVRWGDVNIGDE